MAFVLHPQLAADTYPIASLPLCETLLMNNSLFPWVILVPRVENASEIIDLAHLQRGQLMDEISLISEALKSAVSPDKLNVAALGNQVPQLHIHIIARFKADSAWPNPVWGMGRSTYTEEAREALLSRLKEALKLSA
ncbi:MAG: HIT family protein [Rickettsiales bacterium]